MNQGQGVQHQPIYLSENKKEDKLPPGNRHLYTDQNGILIDAEQYIGTKVINAKSMNRGDYNAFRGWKLPDDENHYDPGYIVQYVDGYISWSPFEQFNSAYRRTIGLSFSEVLDGLKIGARFTRTGWNGKDMFIFLVEGSQFEVNRAPLLGIYPGGTPIDYRPHIDMRYADGTIGVWLASHSDMLVEDWEIVNS